MGFTNARILAMMSAELNGGTIAAGQHRYISFADASYNLLSTVPRMDITGWTPPAAGTDGSALSYVNSGAPSVTPTGNASISYWATYDTAVSGGTRTSAWLPVTGAPIPVTTADTVSIAAGALTISGHQITNPPHTVT